MREKTDEENKQQKTIPKKFVMQRKLVGKNPQFKFVSGIVLFLVSLTCPLQMKILLMIMRFSTYMDTSQPFAAFPRLFHL